MGISRNLKTILIFVYGICCTFAPDLRGEGIMNRINNRVLYLIAGVIWGVPGLMVATKGIAAYAVMPADELWWLLLITLCVLSSFLWMFHRIVNRYCNLIAALPEKTSILHTFPLRGWILIACMCCLGIALKYVPFIPAEFTASFYSGLGPALVVAGFWFVKRFRTL